MTKKFTLGVHTFITNPFSAGYLAYLASIESWAKIADEVVVVDGGSTDCSIEMLSNWLGFLNNKIRIVISPESFWGQGDNWCWPQIAINRQIGLNALTTDWAIHVDADHVCVKESTIKFLRQLECLTDTILLSMHVGFYYNGKYHYRKRKRAWILNLSKIRSGNLKIGYGIDRKSKFGLDYPILIEDEQSFTDPLTGFKKKYYIGNSIKSDATVDLECLRYGHFFFNRDQCLEKCLRIERAIGRFGNHPVKNSDEILLELNLNNIIGYEKKEDILKKNHPEEISRLIDRFYVEGMLGGAIYKSPGVQNNLRTLWTRWRRRLGKPLYYFNKCKLILP
ncbi:MAG: glycosyltransferase [candidate division WOR-3 bacterium]